MNESGQIVRFNKNLSIIDIPNKISKQLSAIANKHLL